jgi:hypothetical protein
LEEEEGRGDEREDGRGEKEGENRQTEAAGQTNLIRAQKFNGGAILGADRGAAGLGVTQSSAARFAVA